MENNTLAPNESMQLHELLTFKNISLTKCFTMASLITDEELKAILQNDVTTTQRHIKELRGLLQQSELATSKRLES